MDLCGLIKIRNFEYGSIKVGKKVIEINKNHELIKKLPSISSELQKATCRVLYEQARIQDGEMPADTKQFSQDLIKLALEI